MPPAREAHRARSSEEWAAAPSEPRGDEARVWAPVPAPGRSWVRAQSPARSLAGSHALGPAGAFSGGPGVGWAGARPPPLGSQKPRTRVGGGRVERGWLHARTAGFAGAGACCLLVRARAATGACMAAPPAGRRPENARRSGCPAARGPRRVAARSPPRTAPSPAARSRPRRRARGDVPATAPPPRARARRAGRSRAPEASLAGVGLPARGPPARPRGRMARPCEARRAAGLVAPPGATDPPPHRLERQRKGMAGLWYSMRARTWPPEARPP
jgi:hypothetical protein